MDVLLARDGDLLRLVFEVLDVVVDVENVFVKLGKVVELRGKPAEAGGLCCCTRVGLLETILNQDKESRSSPPF